MRRPGANYDTKEIDRAKYDEINEMPFSVNVLETDVFTSPRRYYIRDVAEGLGYAIKQERIYMQRVRADTKRIHGLKRGAKNTDRASYEYEKTQKNIRQCLRTAYRTRARWSYKMDEMRSLKKLQKIYEAI